MGMGGAMNSCGRCLKFSLLCSNIFIFLGGVAALSLGVWVWVTRSFSTNLMSNNMYIASMAVVMAMGAALTLLSILGCCGATMEVKCMLLTYYILIFIIFIVMLVGGILQLVFREKIVATLDREMRAAMPYYGVKHEYTKAWDDTQTYLQCCGVKNYSDWNDKVPESCCKEAYPGKRLDCKDFPNASTIYSEGCLDKATQLLRENAIFVGSVAIIVAVFMLLGLVFSCGLFVKIE